MLPSKAMYLQRGVLDDSSSAARDAQKSFVDTPEIVYKRLKLIVGHSRRGG